MNNLFSNVLAMSIAGSVVVGLMLLLRPVTAKIFPAKWQYGIGKMAIAFFLLPVFLFAGKFPLVQPVIESYPAQPHIIQKAPPTLPSNGFVDTMDTLVEKHLTVELTQAILLIWFVGAMVFAGWHIYCYRRFSKQFRIDSFPVSEDTATTALLSSCKAALGIHIKVKLMMNPKIKSPMLVGLCRPMILLPTSNMREHDLKLVLTHELMHLKRKDLWVKMLALLAGTVHWFNPFVHVLRKDISTWGELSCDEALACDMSNEERKHYGEAILNTLDNHSGINTAFCSSLCESRKHIERRLTMLLNVKKMKKHVALFAVVAIVAIAGIGTTVAALAAENTPNLNGVQLLSKGAEPLKHEQPSDNNKGQNQQPLPNAVSSGELEILEDTSMSFGVDSFSIVSPDLASNDYVKSSSSYYIHSETDNLQFSIGWNPMGQKIQIGFISKNDNSQQYWISEFVGGSASGTISTKDIPSGEYYIAIGSLDSNVNEIHVIGNFGWNDQKPFTNRDKVLTMSSETVDGTDSPQIVKLDSNNLKMVELKGDGKEYTFEEFKQWLEAARLEAAELVKSGVWTQEQADKKLALYENTLVDIEQKGGRTFGKMIDKGDEIFPETINVFYTIDELVFKLPAKLADTTNGEVGFGLSVQPKK